MKPLFFFLLLIFSNNLSSQEAYLLAAVDTAPLIRPCIDIKDTKDCFNQRLEEHIQRNLDIRKTYHKAGKAYVQFVISKEGEVRDVKVRAGDDGHRVESQRVIKALEVESPAKLEGERVAVMISLPIIFQTKNFNSYEEYQNSDTFKEIVARKVKEQEDAKKEIIAFDDLSSPPVFSECESILKKKECFERMTQIKLKLHLEKTHHDLEEGTRIKYYFQVDTEGKVMNVAVSGAGKLTTRKSTDFLEDLTFEQPALDRERNPVKTEYRGELVF